MGCITAQTACSSRARGNVRYSVGYFINITRASTLFPFSMDVLVLCLVAEILADSSLLSKYLWMSNAIHLPSNLILFPGTLSQIWTSLLTLPFS